MPCDMFEVDLEPRQTLEWNCKRMMYQRKKNNLTQTQLAQAMGVSHEQITCMERCTSIPSDELLKSLISFFDVPGDYFGIKSLSGPAKPPRLSPQSERQQAAAAQLTKQRQMLRRMMKKAGFPLNCSGLHSFAEAIDESVIDTCQYVNGALAMPSDAVDKARVWFMQVQ